MDSETFSNIALLVVTLAGMYASAFWLAMVIWTYRDHRSRSRDGLASIAAALTVAVLTIPGLLIYALLRPKETLSEAYERSLEEEALLQEIEEKPTCPGCGRRTQADWQVCAYCQTILKKTCHHCGKLLELTWEICPYCATNQVGYAIGTRQSRRRPAQAEHSPGEAYPESYAPQPATAYSESEAVEYIDGDSY